MSFLLDIPAALLERAKKMAALEEVSLEDWIVSALQEKIDGDSGEPKTSKTRH